MCSYFWEQAIGGKRSVAIGALPEWRFSRLDLRKQSGSRNGRHNAQPMLPERFDGETRRRPAFTSCTSVAIFVLITSQSLQTGKGR